MVAGSNLSWQGLERKAVYIEGAGRYVNVRCSVHWKGVYRGRVDTGGAKFF